MVRVAYQTVNPYTGELLKSFSEHTDAEIEAALARAHACFSSSWSTGPVADRAAVLKKAAALMTERAEMLASLITLEMGKRIAESRGEVKLAASIFAYYAEHAEEFLASKKIESRAGEAWIEYEPVGVLVGVEPWNYPYYQLVRFAAPALAVGNPVLLKHAPGVPQCALAFEAVVRDAGAPDGAYTNLFASNDQVGALIDDPRVQGVALTGSERAGTALASRAGTNLKKSTMELGGNDPLIVLDDADVEKAARFAVIGRMSNTGQVCIGSKRFIVVDSVADAFIAQVSQAMEAIAPGDPMDEKTQMGPLSSHAALENLVKQVDDAVAHGAKALIGGRAIDGAGAFMQPTILTDIDDTNPAARQEFFGPVAQLYRVADEDAAIARANDSPFGLGGTVFTGDTDRGRRVAKRMQTGMVFINGPATSMPELPFGGVKRSGYGRELAENGIHEFVNQKTVCVVPSKAKQTV